MRILSTLPLLLVLCACVMTSAPRDDVGFTRVTDLHMLEGCYRNSGDGGRDVAAAPLSAVIWPSAHLDSKTIDTVEVVAEGQDALVVTAYGGGGMVTTSRFVKGEDFELDRGRIKVKSHIGISPGTESGNPFIGLYTDSEILGLDKAGNGRLLSRGNILGTSFIGFPTVAHMREAVRYARAGCHRSPDSARAVADSPGG
jgi:hypothetical protein